MSLSTSRTYRLPRAWLWALLCAFGLMLAGCGGGGASANSNDGGGAGAGANGRTGTTSSVGSAVLTGVVAVGTPVLGGTVRVYDALGVLQGTATTSSTDGSYTLNLSGTRSLPLFVQASGTDLLGTPVVLHTVVRSLVADGATLNHVHLNPLTDAVVALLLGGDPAGFFAAPTAYAAWAQLSDATAITLATNFVKTILAANFRDAGLTNTATVNFFSDPAFLPNKTGVDAVLEGIRAQFGQSGAIPTLQLSNRLALAGSNEVTINLSLARDLLAGKVSTVNDTTFLSAAKVTTGHTAAMPSLSRLGELTALLNGAMGRHLDLIQMGYEPLFDAAYTHYDGRSQIETLSDLVDHGLANHQFSDFQIVGCLDEVVAGSGCVRIGVAALVRDTTTQAVVGVYRNAVSFTAQNGWRLRGNDRQTPWTARTVAWQTWDGAGSPVTVTPAVGEAANAGTGVEIEIIAREFMRATITMPSNLAVVFDHCDIVNWTPMCRAPQQKGDVLLDRVIRYNDDLLQNLDLVVGARYSIFTETVGNGEETNNMRLTAALPTVSSTSIFPLPDAITTTPITIGDLVAGLTVSWNTWATANPQLRMVEVYAAIRSTTSDPLRTTIHRVQPGSARQVTLDAFPTVPGDAQTYVLWMVAEDGYGRRYISKIFAQ